MTAITALEAILKYGLDNSQVSVVTQFADESFDEFIIRDFDYCLGRHLVTTAGGIEEYPLIHYRPTIDYKWLAVRNGWLSSPNENYHRIAPEVIILDQVEQQTISLYRLR